MFDLTRVLAGPTCVQMLADLGADVIKIEKPGTGDDTRGFAPPYHAGNQGKRLFRRHQPQQTVGHARHRPTRRRGDRPRADRRRATYWWRISRSGRWPNTASAMTSFTARFPGLIYCSITGFGQTGPYAQRPGYDSLIQAMGGVMSLTGEPDGQPQKVGIPLADLFAGLYGCIGILAALRHRDATGEGQQIDIGMLDTHVAWLANQGMNYLATGENPPRLGNQHPNIVPYQVFPTRDGHVVLSIANDADLQAVLRGLSGSSHLAGRCALCHQRGAGREPRPRDRHADAGDEDHDHRRMGGSARSPQNRGRSDQHAARGVCRPASASARRRRPHAACRRPRRAWT